MYKGRSEEREPISKTSDGRRPKKEGRRWERDATRSEVEREREKREDREKRDAKKGAHTREMKENKATQSRGRSSEDTQREGRRVMEKAKRR
jgi:hypothetical protein